MVEIEHCDNCNKDEEEVVDSCWGFFGDNPLKNGMIDYLDDKEICEALEKEYK